MKNQSGQSLLELIIVITVTLIVITSLVFATLSSLRNAQFAKNQVQATKLAQQGLEKIRSSRDKNGDEIEANYDTDPGNEINNWKGFWAYDINNVCGSTESGYYIFTDNRIKFINCQSSVADFLNFAEELVNDHFKRAIIFDKTIVQAGKNIQRTVSVIVTWTDFSGVHESRLTTILKNPNI